MQNFLLEMPVGIVFSTHAPIAQLLIENLERLKSSDKAEIARLCQERNRLLEAQKALVDE